MGLLSGCRGGSGDDSGPSDDGASSAAAEGGEDPVDAAMGSLTTEQKVAQLFVVRPESLVPDVSVVVAAGDATRSAIEERPVGGICYFGSNLQDADQVRTMLSDVERYAVDACGLVPFKAVDEEGGTVSRIGGAEGFDVANVGNMRDIGDAGDASRAADAATTVAGYLLDLGFNLDLAPVCDIADEGSVMYLRSFGSTADAVCPMVEAQVGAFLSAGIACCAKHFPGIGAATGDSEVEPIETEATLDEMRASSLEPFRSAMGAGVPLVMVGHLSCPNVTGGDEPASLSRTMVTDVLRGELGYDGLVVTDSLEMGAVSSYDPAEIGVLALRAGVDLLLMPSDFDACYQGVLDAVSSGDITGERLDESVRRIVAAKLGA